MHSFKRTMWRFECSRHTVRSSVSQIVPACMSDACLDVRVFILDVHSDHYKVDLKKKKKGGLKWGGEVKSGSSGSESGSDSEESGSHDGEESGGDVEVDVEAEIEVEVDVELNQAQFAALVENDRA